MLSFDHVHYRSCDFETTRKFYVDVMEAIDLGPIILGGKPNLQLALGGATLLFAPAGDHLDAPVPADKRLGVYHIAFLVSDCEAATQYYANRGATVAIRPTQFADNIIGAFLNAPDGMTVELKQILH
jgi:catechol 2,3-dioxygenase-like lactoylglutathione lyase family enzyme